MTYGTESSEKYWKNGQSYMFTNMPKQDEAEPFENWRLREAKKVIERKGWSCIDYRLRNKKLVGNIFCHFCSFFLDGEAV